MERREFPKTTLEEFEKSFGDYSFASIYTTWPNIAHTEAFDGGMDDLYSTEGRNTPQGVKQTFFEIQKFADTLVHSNGRPCSATAWYDGKNKHLHVIMHTGANGNECSMKQSFKHAIKMIDKLNEMGYRHDITDIHIDNCDDVYGFYFLIQGVE